MTAFALVFLVLAAGCGGGNKSTKPPDPKPDPIPATAGPDCTSVANHVVTVALADKPDLHAKGVALVRTRCSDDKWADDVRSCFATAASHAEVEGCVEKLPEPQRRRLEAEGRKLVGDSDATTAAPPPSSVPDKPDAKPRGNTRGGTKKGPKPQSGDPCQGGEAAPCQGGE